MVNRTLTSPPTTLCATVNMVFDPCSPTVTARTAGGGAVDGALALAPLPLAAAAVAMAPHASSAIEAWVACRLRDGGRRRKSLRMVGASFTEDPFVIAGDQRGLTLGAGRGRVVVTGCEPG